MHLIAPMSSTLRISKRLASRSMARTTPLKLPLPVTRTGFRTSPLRTLRDLGVKGTAALPGAYFEGIEPEYRVERRGDSDYVRERVAARFQ